MNSPDQAIVLKPQEFAALGLNQIAYVKGATHKGAQVQEVFAADGTKIAVLGPGREIAFAAVRQQNLEPLSVH